MKTLLILTTVILLAVVTGCSDYLNITDPLSQHNNTGQTKTITGTKVLVWNYAELSINFNDGTDLENQISYFSRLPSGSINNYLITFRGLTNANKLINGYAPLVEVSKDREVVLTIIDANHINQNIELQLDNVSVNEIKFYIKLIQVDANGQNLGPVILKLSHLNVYTIN